MFVYNCFTIIYSFQRIVIFFFLIKYYYIIKFKKLSSSPMQMSYFRTPSLYFLMGINVVCFFIFWLLTSVVGFQCTIISSLLHLEIGTVQRKRVKHRVVLMVMVIMT